MREKREFHSGAVSAVVVDLRLGDPVTARAPGQKTAVASELDELKRSIIRAVEKRERLPQPFFWYLFRTRLSKIREKKELERLLTELLG